MRKILALYLCISMMLTGCSMNRESTQPLPSIEQTPTSSNSAADEDTNAPTTDEQEILDETATELLAVSVPAVTERFEQEDGAELFSYTAPHMQLILPDADVADKVILDFLNRVDTAQADAESILNSAKNDYTPNAPWVPYFYQIIYSPTRIDHGVLSLFGAQNSYAGGMHGSKSCVAANYDLLTGDVLTLGSIMHMDADKEDFIEIIINKLEDVKEEYYLYDDYKEGVRSRLDGDENLYEDFFFTTTGLSFFFSPYEIAPYASGIITVEIPYNELPGLIYDGYFPAEREQIYGSMHTGSFMSTDMEQFDNMAEVTLVTGEEIMVVYPEGRVEDIRIALPGDGINVPEYTVFAAFEMSDKDAVVISLSKEMIDGITITYSSGDTSVSIPLSE